MQRFDSVPIRDVSVDDQTGFLTVRRVPIAGSMVQPYKKADGTRTMEAKLPEYIFDTQTVESANNKPVTDGHPSELVTKDNVSKYQKGFTTSNAHVEGNKLYNDITITDGAMIDEINNGKRELSIGFETNVVPESGEFNGQRYDSVQKDIKINHVAVVNRGRAGHEMRLLGDSAEAIEDEDLGEESMSVETKTVLFDDEDVEVASKDASKITKGAKKLDDKDKEIAQLKAKIAELEGKSAGNEKKADSLEKELEDYKAKYNKDSFDAEVEKAATERMGLLNKVKPYLGDEYDMSGKSELDVKKDSIKAVYGDSIDLEGKDEGFINGVFQTLSTKKVNSVAGYGGSDYVGDQAEMQKEKQDLIRMRNEAYGMNN